MQTIVIAVAIGLLLAVAYSDLRSRRIPNALTAAIAILGVVRLILADDLITAMQTLIASASVFAAVFILFWRGVFGGGDAKLVTAVALLVGSHGLFDFFLIMSVCGGGLGLAILARDGFHGWYTRRLQRVTGLSTAYWGETAAPERPTVPYGIAIAGAAIVMLILRPVL